MNNEVRKMIPVGLLTEEESTSRGSQPQGLMSSERLSINWEEGWLIRDVRKAGEGR